MKLTENDIKTIEVALGITLYDNQKKYILCSDESCFTERGQGKTLAHMIKLALSVGEPIDLEQFEKYTDQKCHTNSYTALYKREFIKLRNKLKEAGLTVREIK